MESMQDDLVAAVRVAEVAVYGAAGALVLQQLRWIETAASFARKMRVTFGGQAWVVANLDLVSSLCGLSRDQVRRALADLEAKGAIQSTRPHARTGDQTKGYRVLAGRPHDADPRHVDDANPRHVPLYETGRDLETPPLPPHDNDGRLPIPVGDPVPGSPGRGWEGEFEMLWQRYPRKLNRAQALKAYIARRRAGAPFESLVEATVNFAEVMSRQGRDRDKIMHGSTFYGPNDRWRDYLDDGAAVAEVLDAHHEITAAAVDAARRVETGEAPF